MTIQGMLGQTWQGLTNLRNPGIAVITWKVIGHNPLNYPFQSDPPHDYLDKDRDMYRNRENGNYSNMICRDQILLD